MRVWTHRTNKELKFNKHNTRLIGSLTLRFGDIAFHLHPLVGGLLLLRLLLLIAATRGTGHRTGSTGRTARSAIAGHWQWSKQWYSGPKTNGSAETG